MTFDFQGVGLAFSSIQWVWLAPLAMIALDIITGTLCGLLKEKHLRSSVASAGLYKKLGEVAALLAVAVFTYAFGLPHEFVKFFSIYVIYIETLSLFENLDVLGVPVPLFLKERINNDVEDMNKGGN